MDLISKRKLGVLLVVLFSLSALSLAGSAPPLGNWAAAATYTPHREAKIRALGDVSNPVPFIASAPCRQYNSLLATPLAQGVNRTVPLTGAPCGIPASAVAVSVNITIFNIIGATGNGVFKVDIVTPPVVAWINYPPSEAQRGNAGTVAISGGNIVVQVAQGAGQIDFVVDTNGYYGPTPGTPNDTLVVSNTSTLAAIQGLNSSTSSGSAGVIGQETASSGLVHGVVGQTSSITQNSAGVQGVWGSPPPTSLLSPAGVRGDAANSYGVMGLSSFIGTSGVLVNSAGTTLGASGALGYTPDSGTTIYGVYAFGNFGGNGAKFFVEPHPTDAAKVIRYIALEGPESGTYFRGTEETVHGHATIEVPESFRMVTDEEGLTVQLTPVGALSTMAVMSQDLNRIVVKSSKDVTFHYLVHGVRRAFKGFEAITDGREFMPRSAEETIPAYLTEEAKRRLIANGTYNPDGTVNRERAKQLGWDKVWAETARPNSGAAQANPDTGRQ